MTDDIKLLPKWMSLYTIPAGSFARMMIATGKSSDHLQIMARELQRKIRQRARSLRQWHDWQRTTAREDGR